MSTSRILAVTAAVALAGALTAHAQQVSEKANRNTKLITTEEVEAARVNNAYQVEKLHPEWLRRAARRTTLDGGRPRPPSNPGSTAEEGASPGTSDANYVQANESPSTSAVFVDGTEMGGADELTQVQSNLIQDIRYLSGSDAETKYGPRFANGVIEVRLKTR
jgi:hypothetical protein